MITETESIFGYSAVVLLLCCSGIICYICKPLKRVRFQTAVDRFEYSPIPVYDPLLEKIDTVIHI